MLSSPCNASQMQPRTCTTLRSSSYARQTDAMCARVCRFFRSFFYFPSFFARCVFLRRQYFVYFSKMTPPSSFLPSDSPLHRHFLRHCTYVCSTSVCRWNCARTLLVSVIFTKPIQQSFAGMLALIARTPGVYLSTPLPPTPRSLLLYPPRRRPIHPPLPSSAPRAFLVGNTAGFGHAAN